MIKSKWLKGFTLIELIIVMVLTAILMLGIAAFFKPMQTIFSTTSVLDSQRTAVEGINTYVCESVRYATNVRINSSLPIDITTFANDTGIDETKIRVLAICNDAANPFDGSVTTYRGHIFIKKDVRTYLSLGEAYYGKYNYKFDMSGTSQSQISIKTEATNADGTKSLDSTSTCNFANSGMGVFDLVNPPGTGNCYILYTLPD